MHQWMKLAGLCLLLLCGMASASEVFVTYYHNDHLGSPVAATDESGNLLWREHYRPYGERQDRPGYQGYGTLGFTGHAQSQDSGLVYAGARYYDPLIGRFLSVDPKEASEDEPGSLNLYAYVLNNPYKYIDPDGQWAHIAGGALAGGFGGATTGYAAKGWGGVIKGAAIGVVAGAVISAAFQPLHSYAAGSAVASTGLTVVSNGAANVVGQIANNGIDGREYFDDFSGASMVGASLGGSVGGLSAKGVSTFGPQIAPRVIGSKLSQSTKPIALGSLGAQAAIEGTASALGELGGKSESWTSPLKIPSGPKLVREQGK